MSGTRNLVGVIWKVKLGSTIVRDSDLYWARRASNSSCSVE
jgi:hypothetical protein